MHNNVRNLVNRIAIWQLTPIAAQFYKSGLSLHKTTKESTCLLLWK